MKRPYKTAHYEKIQAGYAILLDGQGARTPSGKPLLVPGVALAEKIAAEWAAQGDTLRKETMPLTQIATVAIDLVEARRAEVEEDLLAYAQTDLVCYRAGDNEALQRQQAELLDPILAWVEERFDVAFKITDGVMPVKQPPGNHEKLTVALQAYDDWTLAALAAAVRPLGSIALALAFTQGHIDAKRAFALAHLEETFETQAWGRDEEKEARMERLQQEIESVERFLHLHSSS